MQKLHHAFLFFLFCFIFVLARLLDKETYWRLSVAIQSMSKKTNLKKEKEMYEIYDDIYYHLTLKATKDDRRVLQINFHTNIEIHVR